MAFLVLSLSCPDRRGIVALVSQKLADLDVNIARNSQFSDTGTGMFCMRTRLELQGTPFSPERLQVELEPVAKQLDASLSIRAEEDHARALILVSKYDHCLVDLIYRRQTGEIPIEIPIVASNHEVLEDIATAASIEFEHVPADNKERSEQRIRSLISQHDIDLIVLARYMQILSPEFCRDFEGQIINIHHSFLPGFKGANPYGRAWERGVKLIGATAHYVTADLDEGPIIAQATEPVSHRDSSQSMMVKGRDIERRVLASAVLAHCEDRIFLLGQEGNFRTVVFE